MELKMNNKKILVSVLTLSLLMGCGDGSGFTGYEKQPVETDTDTDTPEDQTFTLAINCSQYVAAAMLPTSNNELTAICHSDYLIAYDAEAKIPRYTSHELTINEAMTAIDRDGYNEFNNDVLLPAEIIQATNFDYSDPEFQRGHMVPWADTGTLENALDTNVFTNVAPMVGDFNGGIWVVLETAIRDYVKDTGNDVFVITGAVKGDDPAAVIGEQVEVPESFYKIVFDGGLNLVGSYLIKQTDRDESNMNQYAVSIDTIEALTGLDFYPTLTVEEQAIVEEPVNELLIFK